MMKTKQELKELKKEYNELQKKLSELTEDELKQVTAGMNFDIHVKLKPDKPQLDF